MKSEIIHKIKGEDGIEAHVAKIDRGYSVVLFDAECEMYADFAKIFKTEAEALAYAKTV